MKTEAYVYLMARSDGCHKIGVSGAPSARRAQIESECGQAITGVGAWRFEAARAYEVERLCHEIFASNRQGGEWFEVGVEDVKSAVAGIAPEALWTDFGNVEDCPGWNGVTITFRYPESDHERILSLLDEEESVAAFMRKAVREHLSERTTGEQA